MERGSAMRDRLRALVPVATGTVGISLLYGQLLVPGRALVDRDIPGLHLPLLSMFGEVARQGVPYWNPWVHGGQPLLTNPHYAAFYPPTWLALLLPAYYAIGLLIVLHAIWAFAGAWRLAKRWGAEPGVASLAGLAFVGGGAFVTSTNMLNLFMGLAWLPWAMGWFSEMLQEGSGRRWTAAGAKAALALAAMLLVGSPIMPLLAVVALACLCLECLPDHPRHVLRVIPVGVTGMALAAVQILPTLRHLTNSSRGQGLAGTTATIWSTPPIRFFEWIWPRIFGDPMLLDSHLYLGYPGIERAVPLLLSIYCGALILALACGALLDRQTPHRRSLGAMMALGVFLALGRFNPIYEGILVKIPPFSTIRFPEKFLLLTTTAMIFAAVLYWQNILLRRERQGRLDLKIPLLVATLILFLSAALYVAPAVAPDLALRLLEGSTADKVQWADAPAKMTALPEGVLASRAGFLGWETFVSLLSWLGVVILLLLHAKPRISSRLLVVLVLTAVTVEAVYYSHTVNSTIPAARIVEPPESLEHLSPTVGRVFSDTILFPQKQLIFPAGSSVIRAELARALERLDPYTATLWGYRYALNPDSDLMLSSQGLQALETLLHDSGLLEDGWSPAVYRVLGAWNVGIVVRRRSPDLQLQEYKETGELPRPARIVRNPELMSAYRGVSQVLFADDRALAVGRLRDMGFDLTDFDAVIDPNANRTSQVLRFSTDLDLLSIEERASRISIDYQTSSEAFLVLAVTADRDWRARVDGVETPIQTTVLGQMGLALPSGRGRLELVHRNPAVAWGALLTFLSLFGCAWALKGT